MINGFFNRTKQIYLFICLLACYLFIHFSLGGMEFWPNKTLTLQNIMSDLCWFYYLTPQVCSHLFIILWQMNFIYAYICLNIYIYIFVFKQKQELASTSHTSLLKMRHMWWDVLFLLLSLLKCYKQLFFPVDETLKHFMRQISHFIFSFFSCKCREKSFYLNSDKFQ